MGQKYPEGWDDPFELYGCFANELESTKDTERQEINKLLDTHSPEWIWKNRMRLVAERLFVRDF